MALCSVCSRSSACSRQGTRGEAGGANRCRYPAAELVGRGGCRQWEEPGRSQRPRLMRRGQGTEAWGANS